MATDDFSRSRLDQMIDLRHPLAVPASRMPWALIEASLAPVFTHRDRKGWLSEGADMFGPTLAVAGAGISNAGRSPWQVQVSDPDAADLAETAPGNRAVDRPHQGRPPHGSMLAQGRRRRRASCGAVRGRLKHPLAAAGHRQDGPGGQILGPGRDGAVCQCHLMHRPQAANPPGRLTATRANHATNAS